MKYLVTGATGGLGGAIVRYLSQTIKLEDIAVLVRSEEKGRALAAEGFDVRVGSFSDKSSLLTAFQGVDTLMFVSGVPGQEVSRLEQHRNVLEAAKEVGISRIVYTSIANGEQSGSVLASDHIATEQLIKDSGMTYKILRNNWYLDNVLDKIQAAVAGQDFVYAGGNGRVGWALRRDYAEAAAKALSAAFDDNRVYELSGQTRTYADLAAAVKEATCQDFTVRSLSVEDYKAELEQVGLPSDVAQLLTAIQADIAHDELFVEKSDLEELLGRPETPIVEAIKELLDK